MGESDKLKRASNDIGWEYGMLVDSTNLDKLKCKLCGKVVSGGIFRIKQHIANIKGNVSACPKSTNRNVKKWVYEAGIPFKAIDSDSFKRFVEAVGQFGSGYQPPRQYLLREPLLKEEVERTKKSLRKQEEEWALNGCSIMTDAWTDRKRRTIMNLCVNCKEGTTFLSSREDSEEAHTGQYIFEYVDKCIEDVGPQNVIQVVTDNASNNMATTDLLKKKRPNIFWTSCAAHTLNLMLEAIGKQPRFKGVIEKAKAFTIFIYAHHKTLALMRKFTKKRDIVRLGVTRFATSFLTLQSLVEKKEKLRSMVTSDSDAWGECKHSKSAKGKAAYSTVLSMSFWNGVTQCLKVFAPSVQVLRLVDGDRKPSMGFLYGELKQAKEEIKVAYKNVEANYRPILEIIDAKAKDRLDRPLHLAAYLLNPYYFFKDQSIENEPMVMDAFITCVEMFFPDDFQLQHLVLNVELLKYKGKVSSFGRALAMAGCACNDDNYDPEVEPGSGLTWGMIGEAAGTDSALEPRRSYRNVEVREFHEEDFQSDQETEEEGDEEYDFESDEERVLEGYGEEELET
ncbi:HAT transposon superfamily protein [Actinidia rufa]|uniref:HAT transposon superfamily protein n=1 Tax=Actinidia rufa TaxID=165716 RepID=A0A7J0DEA2_9ERIC|nr:HAT transposon superfamily protein [Actinidia rufa]